MIICPICEKGSLVKVDDVVSEIEGHYFVESGKRCTECSEESLNEKQGQKTIGIARRMGIWGAPLRLRRKLSKSARGTVLRIPADIEKDLKLNGTEDILISKIGKNKLLIEIGI